MYIWTFHKQKILCQNVELFQVHHGLCFDNLIGYQNKKASSFYLFFPLYLRSYSNLEEVDTNFKILLCSFLEVNIQSWRLKMEKKIKIKITIL